jgi:hypothetical protein
LNIFEDGRRTKGIKKMQEISVMLQQLMLTEPIVQRSLQLYANKNYTYEEALETCIVGLVAQKNKLIKELEKKLMEYPYVVHESVVDQGR